MPFEKFIIPENGYPIYDREGDYLKRRVLWKKNDQVEKGKIGTGCPLSCGYCIQTAVGPDNGKELGYITNDIDGGISLNSRIMFGRKTLKSINPNTIVEELSDYPFYSRKSSILIENFNDPGINNWENSLKIGHKLVDLYQHYGPMVFITKMGISRPSLESFKTLIKKGGHPIVFVTYSNLPSELESVSPDTRLKTMERFHEAGVPVVLTLRPIIIGINDSPDSISKVAKQVKEKVDAVTIGGLFVYDSIAETFKNLGHPLDKIYLDQKYPVAKVLPKETLSTVINTLKTESPTLPIFTHTTCVTSYLMTHNYNFPTPDRLAHWSGRGLEMFSECHECPSDQINICNNKYKETITDIEGTKIKISDTLSKFGYKGVNITFSPERSTFFANDISMTVGEQFSLEEFVGVLVANNPSREELLIRSTEAFISKMKQSPNAMIGAIRTEFEWHLLIDQSKLSKDYPISLVERWLRGENRAWIHCYSIDENTCIDDLYTKIANSIEDLSERERIKKEIDYIYKNFCNQNDIFSETNTLVKNEIILRSSKLAQEFAMPELIPKLIVRENIYEHK